MTIANSINPHSNTWRRIKKIVTASNKMAKPTKTVKRVKILLMEPMPLRRGPVFYFFCVAQMISRVNYPYRKTQRQQSIRFDLYIEYLGKEQCAYNSSRSNIQAEYIDILIKPKSCAHKKSLLISEDFKFIT